EVKRRQLAEAAEKRQMEASSRGIKNVYSVEQKKKKQEEMEKRIAASGSGGGGGLSGRLDKEVCPLKRRMMFTANSLPVSAAEWHLFIMWLLLLAYEDSAVLCHCGRTDVEIYIEELRTNSEH
ncbi:PREDICTED: small VCP/p97-interacting protein, partial [Chlamydotis macqueenii]|uniref:small VCP/p97-interacting protein n=1 Tax=Chlamydotis macqueenii TaxID=187382 RepID=UPI0005298902